MQRMMRLIVSTATATFLFFSYTSANANAVLSIPAAENFCASMTNSSWSGSGKARGPMDCDYNGNGTISGFAPNYKLQIHAEKSGGSFLCPKSVDTTLDATCTSEGVTIHSDAVNLKGTFNGPYQLEASGTVGFLGITDNLTINVHRTS